MTTRPAILLVAVSLALVTGCSATKSGVNAEAGAPGSPGLPQLEVTRVAGTDEYILPGNPRRPLTDLRSVPESLPAGMLLDFKDVPDYSKYDMLVRGKGGKAVPAKYVLPQLGHTQQLGEEYDFTFYYEDGLILCVTPVDRGDGIQGLLESTIAPNTKGETRVFKPGVVRKLKAAVREAGVQKWSSGMENRYPTSVRWVEPSEQGVWLSYALISYDEVPPSLIKIAADMIVLRTCMTGKRLPPVEFDRSLLLETIPSSTPTQPGVAYPEATP